MEDPGFLNKIHTKWLSISLVIQNFRKSKGEKETRLKQDLRQKKIWLQNNNDDDDDDVMFVSLIQYLLCALFSALHSHNAPRNLWSRYTALPFYRWESWGGNKMIRGKWSVHICWAVNLLKPNLKAPFIIDCVSITLPPSRLGFTSNRRVG